MSLSPHAGSSPFAGSTGLWQSTKTLGTSAGDDDYTYDGLKQVLVGRFKAAKDIRYAMKYVNIRATCAPSDDIPVGCVARVEALVDASFTIVDARGQDRRVDKRDQNELALEWTGDKWKFLSGM